LDKQVVKKFCVRNQKTWRIASLKLKQKISIYSKTRLKQQTAQAVERSAKKSARKGNKATAKHE